MKKHPTAPSTAEFYHQQTKYSPENIAGFVPDPTSRPPAFKEYRSDKAIDLKPFLTSGEPPADPDGEVFSTGRSSLSCISRLLYHTGGVTGVLETTEGPHYFRAAPSAGALYPTELYLATRGLPDLIDGIHSYSVLSHSLVPVWEGDFGLDLEEFCFRHAAAIRARAFLIFTGIFQRSAWRYRERAYRRILLDTGHLLGNAVSYAPIESLRLVNIASFYDNALNDLLFLDSREEAALVVAPLIEEREVQGARIASPFPFPSLRRAHSLSVSTDDGIMRFLHRQSGIFMDERLASQVPNQPLPALDLGGVDSPAPSPIPLDPGAGAAIPDLAPVIRRRRSSRRFKPVPLSLEIISRLLRHAYEPAVKYWKAEAGLPIPDCLLADPTLLTTFLVVLRVDGLSPGIYRFDPRNSCLYQHRDGLFQAELSSICLGQDLGRDCAAAVIHTADLGAAVRRYGDRAYRYLHLDAGQIGQRLNLAAVDAGAGASGIGGFFDEQVNGLLGLPDSMITVYITVLGRPAKSIFRG